MRYGYSYKEKDKRSKNIKTDPIELTDKYLKIELELERLIRKEIGEGGYMGFCHKYWWTKKNLLKEKYGIEWKSPVDMNQDVDFDWEGELQMSIRYSKRLSIKIRELPATEYIIVQFKWKKSHDHERKRKHNLLGYRMYYVNWLTDDSGVERKMILWINTLSSIKPILW